MLYVKTKCAVSLDVYQTNQVILVSDDFHCLCNESHPDDHFVSPSWKEVVPSFQSLGQGLKALVSVYSLANNLLYNLVGSHHILELTSHKEIYKMKQPLM